MDKPAHRLAATPILAALLGPGVLAGLASCTESQGNQTAEIVGHVLDRLDRLNSICVADRVVQLREAGGNLTFTPVLRNPREAVSGALRLRMTVAFSGEERSTPGRYVQLPAETSYPAGADHVVTQPEASVTVPAIPGTTYTVNLSVWPAVLRVANSEDPDAVCHIRQFEHSK